MGGTERRLLLFLVLTTGALFLQMWLTRRVQEPVPAAAEQKAAENSADASASPDQAAGELAGPVPAEAATDLADAEKPAAVPPASEVAAAPEAPLEFLTLGSADPKSPYRMLVTLCNRGAAVERIELNQPDFRDVEDASGYLGPLEASDDPAGKGAVVNCVGSGTPAAEAGLELRDVIEQVTLDSAPPVSIPDAETLRQTLVASKSGQKISLEVTRAGKRRTLSTTLRRQPLTLVRVEAADPASFLFTLDAFDKQTVKEKDEELPGLQLRSANWELAERGEDHVTFRRVLSERGIEVRKRFELKPIAANVAAGGSETTTPPLTGYHLTLRLELKNLGSAAHRLAYRLDGPTGLPVEGEWYAQKVSRTWGSSGLRDVAAGFVSGERVVGVTANLPDFVTGEQSGDWEWNKPNVRPLAFLGVDAQFFAVAMIPRNTAEGGREFPRAMPIVVGPVPEDKNKIRLTNASCRLISAPISLKPGETVADEFDVFAGPKQPALLEQYGLSELVYYGWFGAVSRVLVQVMHFFYGITGNYGVAIVLLTVLVRGLMFPVSRQQALSAQKMQDLQPEMKRIAEKYKSNAEQRTKAQQELFRKAGVNPLAGCLPAFLQIPIFMGLYRALFADVELRQAPLISESFPWCQNLAAPDMLFSWASWMPQFVQGWLGPYFNILPLISVGLILLQQKLFMPPPADEQARMQQNMMQYMMIFMGVMFFKVPSGLCIYFIASSLWGLAERKLLPKKQAAGVAGDDGHRASGSNGEGKGLLAKVARERK